MKAKFNVMDGIIVLVLLVVLVAGAVLLGNRNSSAGSNGVAAETKTVQLVIELTDMDENFIKLPQVGDTAMIGVKEKMEVTVVKVETPPAQKRAENIVDGWAGISELPGRYDVRITFQAEGVETNDAVTINGVAARVGEEAFVKSKNWAGAGFFVGVDTL